MPDARNKEKGAAITRRARKGGSPEWQLVSVWPETNLFAGRDLELGLGLKRVAQDVGGQRMLRVQTAKPLPSFKHHANMRPFTLHQSPMPVLIKCVSGQTLTNCHSGLTPFS